MVLDLLTEDPKLALKFKDNIPSLRDLTDLVDGMSLQPESLQQYYQDLSREILSRLTKNLSDFYREENDLEELFDTIDILKLVAQDKEILTTTKGHELFKSGIVLYGPPGVGKTFFVKLLESDTGFKLFSLAKLGKKINNPEEIIEAISNLISDAIKYVQDTKPCILFFDEGETVTPQRNDNGDYQRSLVTGYLLQEINKIREDYPLILPILATNYPERLDEAMIRQGRLDLMVELKKPSVILRSIFIAQRLAELDVKNSEGETLVLTPEQLAELAEISDNFNPLPVVRTVNEWALIGQLKSKHKKGAFEPTFESLKSAFEKESRRLGATALILEERRKAKQNEIIGE